MSDVAKGGRTVLFVSHNLGAIRRLCSHAFVFENGKVAFGGNVDLALTAYERQYRSLGLPIASASFNGPLAEQLQFDEVICRQGGVVVSDSIRNGKSKSRYITSPPESFPRFDLQVALYRDGLYIASCYDTLDEPPLRSGHFVSRFKVPANIFKPGIYTLGVGARTSNDWVWGADVAALDFPESLTGGPDHRNRGVVGIPYTAQRIERNIVA